MNAPAYFCEIVCLANSRQNSGRCIAGKLIDGPQAGEWVRPPHQPRAQYQKWVGFERNYTHQPPAPRAIPKDLGDESSPKSFGIITLSMKAPALWSSVRRTVQSLM
jgi:hypothetical protein